MFSDLSTLDIQWENKGYSICQIVQNNDLPNISANKFLRFIFEKYCLQTNTENVEFIAWLWSFNSFSLSIIMSKEEMNVKENFTYTNKNSQGQVTFKWKSLMKNDPQKGI